MSSKQVTRSRELRKDETRTEKLLWAALRARQICGLKFRRQYAIGPFFADFVCIEHKLILEVDGGYHDLVVEKDSTREKYLLNQGWSVLHVTTSEIEENLEGIGYIIAEQLGLDFSFKRRSGGGSGEKTYR